MVNESNISKVKILTDHGEEDKFEGCRYTIKLNNRFWKLNLFKLPFGSILVELFWGLKCWLVCLYFSKSIPIVTVGHGHGFIFAFMQFILKPFIKPRTHIMFAFLLNAKGTGLKAFYNTIKMKIFKSVVELAIVNGLADVDNFSKEFDIPTSKLRFHPFHITLEKYQFKIKDDGYIFAGGNGARDYHTLIEAVKDIKYPVFIATTLKDIPPLAENYDHITVKGVSPEMFRVKMAGCTFMVECHEPNFFRTGGHQTFLNAMWMGKPFIMADKKSAEGYFKHEVDGLIVEAGDVVALKNEIMRLLDDKKLAQKISQKAKKKVNQKYFTTLNTMQSIYNISINIHCQRNNIEPINKLINIY